LSDAFAERLLVNPSIHARLLAVKRRLAMRFGGGYDPYPVPPDGTALCPSVAHFLDYESVPLALSWDKQNKIGVPDWQKSARSKLAEICGYERRTTPEPVRRAKDIDTIPGVRHQQWYVRVRDGSDIPVSVLRRRDADGPLPIMICLQGTNAGAHLSWGESRMPADPIKIASGADYALQAIERGFAAVCIEQSAFGERRETQLPQASRDPCIDAASHALLLGRTLQGERASDVSSIVDWLNSEAAALSLNTSEIAIMGSSSGGSTAIFAAALDERIGSVLASGCVGLIRDTIGRRGGGSGQNIVPGILNWLEFEDVVGLIAPRPLLVVSGDADHIWPHAGAARVVESARRIYQALDAADKIKAVPAPGGHRFYPDIAWPHFEQLILRREGLA
jgi:hypothetical protein